MNIVDCIGHTPLLHLKKISRILGANIYMKLEARNPGGCIQDRTALACIRAMEKDGRLSGPRCLVEAVDANLGISLALIAPKFDVRLIMCTPSSTGSYAIGLMRELGAEVIVTPEDEGFAGAMAKAAFHRQDTWGAYRPELFSSKEFSAVHYETTGAEILADAEALHLHVDAFVCGVMTGASLTGIGRRLREDFPDVFIAAVEPKGSPVLSGGLPGSHGIRGIGSGLIPGTLTKPDKTDKALISEVLTVADDEALGATRRLHAMEGILAGPAAGANLFGALMLARRPEFKGKNIVSIISDTWRPL